MLSNLIAGEDGLMALEERYNQLSHQISTCQKCDLFKTRTLPMIGDGNLKTKIMMIGEAPGYHEDKTGKAFVGKSGEILDQLLNDVGLSRNQIYITNVLKCRPPHNSNPREDQIEACVPYLYEQIKLIQPSLMITLGKFASMVLFQKVKVPFSKITDMHGKIFEFKASYGQVKIASLYHPSVACYNPNMLGVLKEDFQNTLGILLKK
ncbi:MAG TPA: uracil-DNA glycosylase [Chlamydiales bacterium]|nr:uracil-DNA glycosylase [Chlamydiales bacterium]